MVSVPPTTGLNGVLLSAYRCPASVVPVVPPPVDVLLLDLQLDGHAVAIKATTAPTPTSQRSRLYRRIRTSLSRGHNRRSSVRTQRRCAMYAYWRRIVRMVLVKVNMI